MRKLIEDEFKNVPEGIKIKLDTEMLDELIFSYGYWRIDNDDNYKEFKVPVWTPDCLSKIDLSQLSFKNIWLDGDQYKKEVPDFTEVLEKNKDAISAIYVDGKLVPFATKMSFD